MNKNYLKTILSLVIMVLVFSGCQKVVNNTVVEDPENGNGGEIATSSEENGNEIASSSDKEKSDQSYIITEVNSDIKLYKNIDYGFQFEYPSNYRFSDALIKLHKKNNDNNGVVEDFDNLPWYDKPEYLLVRLNFGITEKKGRLFTFSVINTIDNDKIKSSGGWGRCEKIKEEIHDGKNVEIFTIDDGMPEMKVIKHKDKSYIFMHYLNDDEVTVLDQIISSINFVK